MIATALISLVRRITAGLFLLYPSEFRDRYGTDLMAGQARMMERARQQGWGPMGAALLGALGDALRGLVRERWRGGRAFSGSSDSFRSGGGLMVAGWIRDLKYAARSLRAQPLFTLVAAGSLAIGIGANTAVFSVANTLLLRPLGGISNYERVVELGRLRDGSGFDTFSYPDFADLRSEIPALEAASAYALEVVSVSRDAEGVRASAFYVDAAYFEVLGATPGTGRYFVPEEDELGGPHAVTVLSHRFWVDRFGADPAILNETVYLNREPYTVVGITPEEFRGHMVGIVPDVFVPLSQYPGITADFNMFESRNSSWHMVLGLLAEGATREELTLQLQGVSERLAAAYPDSNERRSFAAMALGPVPGGGRGGIRLFVTALLGMVTLILLVTCTNVAGMFLARAISREREVAVRIALGAGRRTLVQQLTIETLLVFLIGGGLGVSLGLWAVGLINADAIPSPVPLYFAVEPDRVVVGFAAGLTLLTGLVFGLLPAARATRLEVAQSMREEGRGGGRKASRLRTVFAGAQIGLSLILLVTAGLFVRSLQRAASIETGFDSSNRYVTNIDLSLEGHDDAEALAFFRELLAGVRGRNGVERASLSSDLPLDLASSGTTVLPQGWDAEADDGLLRVDMNRVSDGYFEALGIRLLSGRPIVATDREDAPRVVVVGERFVEEVFPDGQALGRTLRVGSSPDAPQWEIVGVAADVKNQQITDQGRPFVYFPLAQRFSPGVQIVIESRLPGPQAIQGLRDALIQADPNMSQGSIVSLEQYTQLGILPQRLAASLTSGLALLALLLSGLGIYGVISFAVGRQTREIGIRMALGEDRGSVTWRFLRGGVLLALPGLVIGGGLSMVVGRVLRTLLLDLSPYDPMALGVVSTLLMSTVALAAWIPARRAARVDPAESLRSD